MTYKKIITKKTIIPLLLAMLFMSGLSYAMIENYELFEAHEDKVEVETIVKNQYYKDKNGKKHPIYKLVEKSKMSEGKFEKEKRKLDIITHISYLSLIFSLLWLLTAIQDIKEQETTSDLKFG